MVAKTAKKRAVQRPALAISKLFPAAFQLAEHRHRRGQFLHAASGVMAVSTADGAWVVPPELGLLEL